MSEYLLADYFYLHDAVAAQRLAELTTYATALVDGHVARIERVARALDEYTYLGRAALKELVSDSGGSVPSVHLPAHLYRA